MRIIYITSSMPYGSRETFVISEVEEVRKQGHEVLIVPMHPRGPVLHTDAKPLLEYVTRPTIAFSTYREGCRRSVRAGSSQDGKSY